MGGDNDRVGVHIGNAFRPVRTVRRPDPLGHEDCLHHRVDDLVDGILDSVSDHRENAGE